MAHYYTALFAQIDRVQPCANLLHKQRLVLVVLKVLLQEGDGDEDAGVFFHFDKELVLQR